LEAGIAGARRVVMEGTAHVPNMEQPGAFNQIVLDFLKGTRGKTRR
jgi:pimeloyl-ACP methyl ester carboxylesterase